jgi:hypothetical protein
MNEDRTLTRPDLVSFDSSRQPRQRFRRVHRFKDEPFGTPGIVDRAACLVGECLIARSNLAGVQAQREIIGLGPGKPRRSPARPPSPPRVPARPEPHRNQTRARGPHPSPPTSPAIVAPDPTATTTCLASGALQARRRRRSSPAPRAHLSPRTEESRVAPPCARSSLATADTASSSALPAMSPAQRTSA